MKTVAVELEKVATHRDVPPSHVSSWQFFSPSQAEGVTRYEIDCPRGVKGDVLLVNKNTETLFVALHGATPRDTKRLPRFEWFRTLRDLNASSMYISDPTLRINDGLALAWYTGWLEWNGAAAIADWVSASARAVGAIRIVCLGSSGGGFAAMQIASRLRDSLAVPFSPQTNIGSYLVAGTSLGAQRAYMRTVMPHLIPESGLSSLVHGKDYFEDLGDRASILKRFERERQCWIFYVQNKNDVTHVEQHYEPFKSSISEGPNCDRVRFYEYDGPEGHNPPKQKIFHEALNAAVDWHRSVSTRIGESRESNGEG